MIMMVSVQKDHMHWKSLEIVEFRESKPMLALRSAIPIILREHI